MTRIRQSGPVSAGVDRDPVVATKALRKFLGCLRPGDVAGPARPRARRRLATSASSASSSAARSSSRTSSRTSTATQREKRARRAAGVPPRRGSRRPTGRWTASCAGTSFDFLDKRVGAGARRPAVARAGGERGAARLLRHRAPVRGAAHEVRRRGRPRTSGTVRIRRRAMRQAVLQNRDIIRLFERLRVSDSFLLHTTCARSCSGNRSTWRRRSRQPGGGRVGRFRR